MPFRFSDYLRIDAEGDCTIEDGHAILRTTINLMIRISGGGGSVTRMFTDEAEVLAWLEQQPLLDFDDLTAM